LYEEIKGFTFGRDKKVSPLAKVKPKTMLKKVKPLLNRIKSSLKPTKKLPS
jgi:hypothetical protein